MLYLKFVLNGQLYHTQGSAPCTEEAFQKGEFSEKYIKECAYCLIYGYMEVKNLKGKPELISWTFERINDRVS